ncbi:sugar phosphate isomerase/epimerase family protein [Paenibacillus humicola]|uniref:sugar phosphate isomerase/epimerase family protein n=1 Tax=Paenibacillus humicola TaxID=3110540 RepID=UPI00237B40B1|nr:TIM barrel protein [Paenibacillus humicola]
MKFSIGSWSFRELFAAGELSIFGYLQSLKYRYHLDCADIWPGMFTSMDDGYFRRIKAAADAEGIAITSLASDMLVWHDDPAVRERQRRDTLRFLDIASILNAGIMGIDIGVDQPHMTDEQFEYAAEQYRIYSGIAAERGFRIAIQNHKASSMVPGNLKRIADMVDSPSFGLILDSDRWLEDKETGDRLVAPHVIHVHFDRARIPSREELESKIRMLLDAGYRGCWSLEYMHGKEPYWDLACDLAELRRAVHFAAK